MKQLLIIILMFPLLAEADPDLGLALKSGPNTATLDEDSRVSRQGVSGGLAAYLQWPLVDRFALAGQFELLYTPRGAEVVFEGEYLGKSRQHYLDINVGARPGLRLGPMSVYFLLGGGLNILLSANKEIASGMKTDITGDLHRIDVALLAGAGVAFHLPRHGPGLDTVFLEARHDHGLLDTDAVNGGFKNRASSVMLGLSFALSSRQPPPPPVDPSPAPTVPGEPLAPAPAQ